MRRSAAIALTGVLLFHALCQAQVQTVQERRAKAQEYYDQLVDHYMKGRLAKVAESRKLWRRHWPLLRRDQRLDINFIKQHLDQVRPSWWDKCRSSGRVTFTVEIWGRDFKANYVPSGMLGAQGVIGVSRSGTILVIVTWRPQMVDSPQPVEGLLAKRHGITEGHMAEAIVWHELGHNYITRFLPLKHVVVLYQRHERMFYRLQEFYADLTSLYHSSPQAQKVALLMRLRELEGTSETDPHVPAAHAIGALLLNEVMRNPKAWPSFHLPGDIPSEDVERETIAYMYRNLEGDLTLKEHRALRDFIKRFTKTQGEKVLRRRATVMLPGGMQMKLLPEDDREWQPKRDAYVKKRLALLIKQGLTDKPWKHYYPDEEEDSTAFTVVHQDEDSQTIMITQKDDQEADEEGEDGEKEYKPLRKGTYLTIPW
jgi:hypothetical protein